MQRPAIAGTERVCTVTLGWGAFLPGATIQAWVVFMPRALGSVNSTDGTMNLCKSSVSVVAG